MCKNLFIIILLITLTNIGIAANKSDIKVLIVAHNPEKPYLKNYSGRVNDRQKELVVTRGKEFKELLDKYFNQVDIIYSDVYKPSDSKRYDVTIFDDMPKPIESIDFGKFRSGKSILRNEKPLMYARYLPADFDCAMITIGSLTDNFVYTMNSKLWPQ